MTQALRRGWCPSLAAPMETGDGLLVRLYPRHGLLSPAQLSGLAGAAGRHGNGLIEITTRGNLQFRGLSPRTMGRFEADVLALGVDPEPAPEIRTPPLAALDAATGAVLRETADRLRAALDAEGLAAQLSPKFAILIGTEGDADLAATSADIRLTLAGSGGAAEIWHLSIAGDARGAKTLGCADRDGVVAAAMSLARTISIQGRDTRARTLGSAGIEAALEGHSLAPAPAGRAVEPSMPGIGRRASADGRVAVACAPAFGQIEAADLEAFCRALPAAAMLSPAPGKRLLAGGLSADVAASVVDAAGRSGMVVRPGDPRLSILACAGAPACASGRLATRALARRIAGEAADLAAGRQLYLAGCAKQCGRPDAPHVAAVGVAGGVSVDAIRTAMPEADRARLAALSAQEGRL